MWLFMRRQNLVHKFHEIFYVFKLLIPLTPMHMDRKMDCLIINFCGRDSIVSAGEFNQTLSLELFKRFYNIMFIEFYVGDTLQITIRKFTS